MSIHQRIKEARVRLKLSEQELADVAGLTRSSVQQWEREDGTAPARKHQKAVAAKLEMTVAELVDGVPETNAVLPHGSRLTNRATVLAEAFDEAAAALTRPQRSWLFRHLIQAMQDPIPSSNALETLHSDTPAEHYKA